MLEAIPSYLLFRSTFSVSIFTGQFAVYLIELEYRSNESTLISKIYTNSQTIPFDCSRWATRESRSFSTEYFIMSYGKIHQKHSTICRLTNERNIDFTPAVVSFGRLHDQLQYKRSTHSFCQTKKKLAVFWNCFTSQIGV